MAERNLQARSNNRIYQAAGNQYIYDKPAPAPAAVSNTLPRDTPAFIGRDPELRSLVEKVAYLLDNDHTIPVHAIDGMPGIGKTALAVRAGHSLTHRFPDGQFFIDLHAHSPHQGPVRPTDALFGLLTADGFDASQVPTDTDSRAALWRGRVAGKKALIILDNAAGHDQIEPLLPGAPGCLVLITSRRRLTGLSSRHHTVPLPLTTLSPEHASELFATRAARPNVGADAITISELVNLCGHLPLAICLLAARLYPEPQWHVADLVQELSRANDRLHHMYAETIGVAAAFDLSYRRLPAGLRRFFRRLGLHPGTEIDPYAAAALDAISPSQARRHLETLYHDHLVDQPNRGRYRMHDLIREYARHRAGRDPARDRAEATNRLLDYYQHAAQIANRQLARPGRHRPDDSPRTPAALPDIHNRQDALAWMNAERGNLAACLGALTAGQQTHRIVTLAAATAPYLRDNGPWDHAVSLHQAAASAARRAGNRRAQADALRELGTVHRASGNYTPATNALHQALDLYQQLDHPCGVADTLTQLATVRRHTGDHPAAISDLQNALAIYEKLDDRHGLAAALNELGVVHHQTDNRLSGIQALQRALAIHHELGDLHGQADALNQLGTAHQIVSDYHLAIDAHRRALDIYLELGDRHGQARALNYLCAALCETGDLPTAKHTLTDALAIHRRLGYRLGEANALTYLGTVHSANGDYTAAEHALTRALALYRNLGYRTGQSDALNQLGTLARLTGRHDTADALHHEALTIAEADDDPLGQAQVLNQLGQLLLARNQPAHALDCHQRALHLARHAQNRREEAQSLEGVGRCAQHTGNQRQAAEHLDRARDIYQQLSAPAGRTEDRPDGPPR
ncbi:ATP-binding protein [Plantactinospora sp. WMMB334]|uniref:ATP-binding protein n=1 Tax=Plantactinospora sp. WMMB334 TaxID=3404119 RepID=UPI003B95AD93